MGEGLEVVAFGVDTDVVFEEVDSRVMCSFCRFSLAVKDNNKKYL